MPTQRQRLSRWGKAFLLLISAVLISLPVWALNARIEGVEGDVKKNVRLYLSDLDAEQYTAARLKGEIQRRVREAMRVYGYYEPQIAIEQLEEERVQVDITSGPRVTIEVLDINLRGEAADDPPFSEAVDEFPLEVGDPLFHSPWDRLRNQLSGLALERGYFDWEFTDSRMEVRPFEQSARLYMDFDSGSRYQFGNVRIIGSHIEPERLQRMQPFTTGEPYEAQALARYNQRLAQTGWFESVMVRPRLQTAQELLVFEPDPDPWFIEATGEMERRPQLSMVALTSAMTLYQPKDNRLPLDVTVEPADRHQFEVGIGYATDVGPRLGLGWRQPWINRLGHSLDHELYISAPEQRFTGTYNIPLEDPVRDNYRLQYGIRHEDDNDTRTLESTVEVARRWEFENRWVQTLYFRATFEDFTQGGEADQVWIFYPGIQWSRTRTRNQRFPSWGDRQQLSLEYSDTAWGSDAQFGRLTADTQWIRMLGNDNRFVGRASLGAIATDDFDQLPPSLRFFAGGDRSVRGYSFESLSPVNEEGRLRGGQQKLTASVEYQRRVIGDWWGAGFVDAGDAFDDWTPDSLNTGAGLGVRWVSPVGPIRLDVAHPFDHEDDWRLHFSIGPEF
ncbi:autotransporter assembly complex protein TamA [Halomonas sediminis]